MAPLERIVLDEHPEVVEAMVTQRLRHMTRPHDLDLEEQVRQVFEAGMAALEGEGSSRG